MYLFLSWIEPLLTSTSSHHLLVIWAHNLLVSERLFHGCFRFGLSKGCDWPLVNGVFHRLSNNINTYSIKRH